MIDENERVILVSECDEDLGAAQKLDVHRSGALHRAFSVILFDDHGRVLLQRRAASKYHSPALWSNTCCGHPRPGESTIGAAARRLHEEMGVTSKLIPLFSFIYRADLRGGLVEHELDHVFVGQTADFPCHDRTEVDEWRWIEMNATRLWLQREPQAFTAWFAPVFAESVIFYHARSNMAHGGTRRRSS
ncbi:MAG TPA: isopentenyl-diphosphate Delta-isomerase [Gemmatimonadaceae bacterium]|nr:isopentenyl-diphosphate Delta-isomerase [Gemmatimonadaceae bacterium]